MKSRPVFNPHRSKAILFGAHREVSPGKQKTRDVLDDATIYWQQMTQTPSLDQTILRQLHSKITTTISTFFFALI